MTANRGLTNKQKVFIEEYLSCWNASEAARRAGYKNPRMSGSENLTKPDVAAEIKQRISEKAMSADEVLTRLADQARANLGCFYKLVEEWTFYPLPTYDILDAQEVDDTSDPDSPVKRISYFVRHVAIDMDKLIDPRYSHLLHKVSDSPKGGIEIELYNAQAALIQLGKHHKLFTDQVEHSGTVGRSNEMTADDLAAARERALKFEQEILGDDSNSGTPKD